MYSYFYKTPEGFSDIFMTGDPYCLTGLWFESSKDSSNHNPNCEESLVPVFERTIEWLDIYFSGKDPGFLPEYRIDKITPFRREVCGIMLGIPFGETLSYGEIARRIAVSHGIDKMSSRAVGQAVGWNPICIIIPCHRVLGSDDRITGYGGGIENKIALLENEGHKY